MWSVEKRRLLTTLYLKNISMFFVELAWNNHNVYTDVALFDIIWYIYLPFTLPAGLMLCFQIYEDV